MTTSLRAKASRIRKNNTPQNVPESGRIDNLSSILSSRIARVYREDDQFLLGIDNKFSQSLDDAGQHKRLHAGPRGIHIAMGRIHQYSRPKKEKNLSSVNGAFDIFWMRMAVENPKLWTAEQPWRICIGSRASSWKRKSTGRELKTALIALQYCFVSILS